MKISFQILFGLFFLFLMVFVSLGCNAATYETKSAWKCYRDTVNELEDSHFEKDMVVQAVKAAEQKGYQVAIKEDCIYQDSSRYQVTLFYEITIPILHIKKQQSISGYAV